jgi:hypothetical protein
MLQKVKMVFEIDGVINNDFDQEQRSAIYDNILFVLKNRTGILIDRFQFSVDMSDDKF